MKEQTTILTWGKLRDFCNSLPEKYNDTEVRWLGEERGGVINSAECFDEDQINPSGDGIEPVSVYKDEPEILENEDVIFKKGHPALFTDF